MILQIPAAFSFAVPCICLSKDYELEIQRIWKRQLRVNGRDPFNRNLRAEVRKFLGVEWIATSPDCLVPFHPLNEFRAIKNGGSMLDHCMLLVLELDDDFDGDINDIVRDFSCVAFSNQYNGIFWIDRYQIFAVWVQKPLSNDKKNIPNSLGK